MSSSSPGRFLSNVKDYMVVLEQLERSSELLGSMQPGAAASKGSNSGVAANVAALMNQAHSNLVTELQALMQRVSSSPAPPDCLLALIQYDSVPQHTSYMF